MRVCVFARAYVISLFFLFYVWYIENYLYVCSVILKFNIMDNVKQLPQNVSVNSTELNPGIDLKPHVYVACCLNCRYYDPQSLTPCNNYVAAVLNEFCHPGDDPSFVVCDEFSRKVFVEGGVI